MAPGVMQIAVIILLVVVLFGAGRIPTIMENLAKGVNSFKKGLKDDGGDTSDKLESKSEPSNDPDDVKKD